MKINQRLSLEVITDPIADLLFLAIDDNRAHLSAFLSWVGNMKVPDDFKDYIVASRLLSSTGKELSYAIVFNGIPVGRIGLHHINSQNKNASIGYWLTKSAEGNGLILNSCKALISYGFRELKLKRIEIKAAVNNSRSQAVPEKLGFTKEGLLRKAELVNHKFLDLVLYSILDEEWEEKKPS